MPSETRRGAGATSKKSQAWLEKMQAGQRAFRHRQLNVARRAFAAATRLQPKRFEGWVNLGSVLLQLGELDAAETALKRARVLNPTLATIPMLQGDVLRLLGQADAAARAYEEAVSLERSPQALNKLACHLRSRREAATAFCLYDEAIQRDAAFSLARVNRATLLLESGDFDAAAASLSELAASRLPPVEQNEVTNAQAALGEYHRLARALQAVVDGAGTGALEQALQALPESVQEVDELAIAAFARYAASARRLADRPSLAAPSLPPDWPLIEGVFMIPLVNTVDEYLALDVEAQSAHDDAELRESLNVRDAVIAHRSEAEGTAAPHQVEAQWRSIHAICCERIDGFSPGHFKYTQNWSPHNPRLRRVEPRSASATVQHVIGQLYPVLPPGLSGAAVQLLTLLDLHPFADGNARVALTYINRALEREGEMPLLFPRTLGLRGELGRALRRVRAAPDDISPLVNVLVQAQRFAAEFLQELEDNRTGDSR